MPWLLSERQCLLCPDRTPGPELPELELELMLGLVPRPGLEGPVVEL